jgi:hypothetical protein
MTITTYEEGVEQLNNLTLRAINFLDKRLAKLEADREAGSAPGAEYSAAHYDEASKEVVKIVKILPKLLYTLQQVRIMKKEIDAKAESEKEENYSKADLLAFQKHVVKLLRKFDDNEENVIECYQA